MCTSFNANHTPGLSGQLDNVQINNLVCVLMILQANVQWQKGELCHSTEGG